MLVASPILTGVVVLTAAGILFITKTVAMHSAKFFIGQQKSLGAVNGYVEEMITGQKVVKVFNHENTCKKDFDKLNEELCSNAYSAGKFSNMMGPVNNNLGYIQYAILAIVGGTIVVRSGGSWLTLGSLMTFMVLSRNFNMPINQISMQMNSIIMALAGAERIFELMDQEPEVDNGYVTLVNAKIDENGNIEYVVEVKTVQVDGRSGSLEERWKDGEAPHYQALQASLYAYLLGVDKVLMVAVALEDKKGDYENPEQVVPSFANGNVYIDEFKVSERYPNFELYIEMATDWWNKYVLTGMSPKFDEKKDAEILAALRTNTLNPDTDIAELIEEAEQLKAEIDSVYESISDKEKRLEGITKQIKSYAQDQFRDGDTKVSIRGKNLEYVLSKTDSTEIDKKMLEADGLLEKYSKAKVSYRLTTSKIKED